MSTAPNKPPTPPTEHDANRGLYWGVAAIVVALLVVGLVTWSAEESSPEARAKAEQLSQKLRAAGLPVPVSQKRITRTLGTDGGAVCANPASTMGKATLNDMITNGADFVGRRPVIIDRRALLGQFLIMQTYCPDKLEAYRRKIDDLKLDTTIRP